MGYVLGLNFCGVGLGTKYFLVLKLAVVLLYVESRLLCFGSVPAVVWLSVF